MKKIKAVILALRIEYHWFHVMVCRGKLTRLIEQGATMNAGPVLRVNGRLSFHALRIMCLEDYYLKNYAESFGGVL